MDFAIGGAGGQPRVTEIRRTIDQQFNDTKRVARNNVELSRRWPQIFSYFGINRRERWWSKPRGDGIVSLLT